MVYDILSQFQPVCLQQSKHMLFELFGGILQCNVVNYDRQHNYNRTWSLLGPQLTACEYKMGEIPQFL